MKFTADGPAENASPPPTHVVPNHSEVIELHLNSLTDESSNSEPEESMVNTPQSAASNASTTSSASRRTMSSSSSRATSKSASSKGSSVSLASTPVPSDKIPFGRRRRSTTPRTQRQEMVRALALVVVPLLLAIPSALTLVLIRSLLQPLFNSLPLGLHRFTLHAGFALPSAIFVWALTRQPSPRRAISAPVCLTVAAQATDVVALGGRRVGSLSGGFLGPEWGAFAAQYLLGLGVVVCSTSFALLCYDHLRPVTPHASARTPRDHAVQVVFRTAIFAGQVLLAEWAVGRFLDGNRILRWLGPEKLILLVSLMLTILSLFVRPPLSDSSVKSSGQRLHSGLSRVLRLTPAGQRRLAGLTDRLPASTAPLLLLLRVPILILALRAQLFSPRTPPYLAADAQLRVLSSTRSLTGQIVVAENLRDGYRFLRCDHSILGGKWVRKVRDRAGKGGERTIFGDSIFAAFALQEVGLLATRQGHEDGMARTISMTTELQLEPDTTGATIGKLRQDKRPNRALVIGLGVGISAQHLADRGVQVDVVEVDPAVYNAAVDHFDFRLPNSSGINLMDGAYYVQQLSEMQRSSNATMPKWDYVIQDCFTGGSVPGELFTLDFWSDVTGLMAVDGILAMNFAGMLHSRASKAVLVTLTSVFTQCRAFSENPLVDVGTDEMINLVVLCTMAHSPLLSFRQATAEDVARSPLRSHVYTTFLRNEIRLDEVITDSERADQHLMLRRGKSDLDKWQVGTSMATWYAMQKLLTPEMWLAW